MRTVLRSGVLVLLCLPLLVAPVATEAQTAGFSDPGPRPGPAGAGGPIAGLTAEELAHFETGLDEFLEVEGVADGLGPRFNLDSCGGCHTQPAPGGTSPTVNPQPEAARRGGAKNTVPSFITTAGPVREVRFKSDGGVHALFTIAGRADAPGCTTSEIQQPDFGNTSNISFRIPTPAFGLGLIETITDSAIVANQQKNDDLKRLVGISGRPNREGNTGTITRFGWKAQNKSGQLFAGEAYNVEQGVTNEIFQTERDESPACTFNGTPEDFTTADEMSNTVAFSKFTRFLAPPVPAVDPAKATSIQNGKNLFSLVGCALCHTPSLQSGKSSSAALNNKPVNLFSDLLLHDMGDGLADGISQGQATGREFRTAPLWGLGQRLFFLHDGRTPDLAQAIQQHSSSGSEGRLVVAAFNLLPASQKQDILNFLRSL